MIPSHSITPTPQIWYYLFPDDREPSLIEDFELGGIELSDSSQGLRVQVWRAFLSGGVNFIQNVMIESPTHPASVLFTAQGVTQVALAFDQNMHPFIAFVQNGQARFWWFDPTIPGQTFTNLPVGSITPAASLDDKRQETIASSDTILSYIRAGTLYWREQRDRFLIEYTVATGVTGELIRTGMNGINRFQWAVGLFEAPSQVNINRSVVDGRRRGTTQGNSRQVVGTSYV